MQIRNLRLVGAAAAFVALSTLLVACGSDGSDGASNDKGDAASEKPADTCPKSEHVTPETDLDAILVPGDYDTIQEAVNNAKEGDLVLVGEGIYCEAVDVDSPNITIRGVDRTKVILDGQFKLENGFRILETDGVVIENMTARNFTSNGFYWTGSDHYRGSYLTAYRNGDYGLYAYDAYHGQFDHSLGSGSPDAGVYVGECFRCDTVVSDVISEYNGLGYSGTNSGGDMYVVNSTFRYNRAGIAPNSGAYELCYPNRETTIAGNIVHDNNNLDNPGISVSLLVGGIGIVMGGTVKNTVQNNLVYTHDRWGILALTLPEEDAADNVPPAEDDQQTCEDAKKEPLPDPEDVPGLVLWQSRENKIIGNTVTDSTIADIAMGGVGVDLNTLNNCWSDNTFGTSEPPNIEEVAPCGATGTNNFEGAADTLILVDPAPEPPDDRYHEMPLPKAEDQPSMPDALTAPATPFTKPELPDVDSIELPAKPEN